MQTRLTAGELDRRIRIIPVTTEQDATGEPIDSDGVGFEIWARKMESRVSERFSGASDQVAADVIFRIRWRDDFGQTAKVAFGEERFEIVGIVEFGRRVGLDLSCRRLGENV